MERVKVYGTNTIPSKSGRGLFAEALMQRFPNLPVEEEGRLNDPPLRENFVERVFAYRRVRSLFGGRWTLGALVAFHTAHKLQLMAHSPKTYEQLGRFVAIAKNVARAEVRDALRVAVHARPRAARNAPASHQRAAAHGRVLQEAARRRRRSASCNR